VCSPLLPKILYNSVNPVFIPGFKIRCRENRPSYNAPVSNRVIKFLALLVFVVALSSNADAASARIKKVLPQLIDSEGRNSLSPSLYERDAYQAFLRNNPAQRAGLKFEVQWGGGRGKDLTLQIEMRGGREAIFHARTLKMPVKKKGFFSTWSSLVLRDEAYKNFGDLVAWRATLWDGDKQISEQKSFLW
jgi:hypothetical protein